MDLVSGDIRKAYFRCVTVEHRLLQYTESLLKKMSPELRMVALGQMNALSALCR